MIPETPKQADVVKACEEIRAYVMEGKPMTAFIDGEEKSDMSNAKKRFTEADEAAAKTLGKNPFDVSVSAAGFAQAIYRNALHVQASYNQVRMHGLRTNMAGMSLLNKLSRGMAAEF
jgi:hypothetical protein